MLIGMIDDDQSFINHFKEKLFPLLKNLDEKVELLTSTTVLPLVEIEKLDLLFLDIQLKDDSGINYALELRDQLQSKIPLVFMSSKNDLVFETLATTPMYFIRKNNLDSDFEIFLKLFKKNFNTQHQIITINQNTPIKVLQIVYISAYGHDVTIQTDTKQYLTSGTMKKIVNQISHEDFIQIQKSTTIHLRKIVDVKQNTVIMSDASHFEVSRLYKKQFQEKYMEYLLK